MREKTTFALYFGNRGFFPEKLVALARKEIKLDTRVLDRYLGYYKTAQGVVMSVTKQGDRLFITLPGQKPQQIFPETKNLFFVKIADSTVTFDTSGSKEAKKLQLKHGDSVIDAVKLEPKVGVFSGSRQPLRINLVVAGPFVTKKQALDQYKGNLPADLKIFETDTGKINAGYFVVEAQPWVTEADLEEVKRAQLPPGRQGLDMTFTLDAAAKLQKLTQANKGKKAAYILGDKVVLAPTIVRAISRRVLLTGRFTADEISELIADLQLAISKNKSK